MGKDASAAGSNTRDDTKHKRRTAFLLAALWPSLLGPDYGPAWRAENRRIWRRRLAHVALTAVIFGIGAGAAAPSLQRHDSVEDPAAPSAAGGAPTSGSAGEAGRADGHAHPLSIPLRSSDDAGETRGTAVVTEPIATPASDPAGDHRQEAPARPEDRSFHSSSEPGPYSPTPAFYGGGFGGGIGGGFGGAGGSRGSGGGSSPGAPQDVVPSPSDAETPGEPADPGAPPENRDPEQLSPPYIVDPDYGPHQPGDPEQHWPPRGRPQLPPSPAPEPQTWLMMLFGFGSLGCILRLRRTQFARMDTRRLAD